MVELDFDHVPFSAFGSYLGVVHIATDRAPQGVAGPYLCTYHNGHKVVLRLVPERDGMPVDVTAVETPTLLQMSDAAGGTIEYGIDGQQTLRIRGRGGLALRVEQVGGVAVLYSSGEGRATFNVGLIRRYEFECLDGHLERHDAWNRPLEEGETRHLTFLPDGGTGTWEVAVDEFWSTWVPRERTRFDACRAGMEEAFQQWVAGQPSAPADLKDARELAAYITWSCVLPPGGLFKRHGMLMSKNWMTNIWSWDHCFNAMALACGHPDLAWDQLMFMADFQDDFGCYPDTVNDQALQYNYCKPPVHGWAAHEMFRMNPELATPARMAELYGTLEPWTEWWLEHRRMNGHMLPYYLHGNDSGWDNSTMFDAGVPLSGPDLAAFMVIQMDVLSLLAGKLQRPGEQERWAKQADEMLAALLSELWDGETFFARRASDGFKVESLSLIPCMPILLGERLPEDIRAKLAARIKTLMTENGPATEHPDSPAYVSDGYWRGPIWAPSTLIAVCGLERSGHGDLALEIAQRFCRMCSRSGMAENYDAITGAPLRDRAYTWTASVFLLLAERLVG